MSIARRLLIIVLLTMLEISITIWAAFQISKGATYHQLNSLHLKNNGEFLNQVIELERGAPPVVPELEATLHRIRDLPVECLELAGFLDQQIMRMIGTLRAIDLCRKDINDADNALAVVQRFAAGGISTAVMVQELRSSSDVFAANSAEFEGLVTRTVEFIVRTMIPMIALISIFNIAFITYLSRTISGSIRHTIELLLADNNQPLAQQLDTAVSGELRELISVAQQRVERDFLNIETNEKLQVVVAEKTASLRAANEELEQFSYRSSHDLKAPLTRCKRLCHIIAEDVKANKSGQALAALDVVASQMESLEKLVEDLMSLAKADLAESNSETIDLHNVLNQVASRLTPQLTEANVEYRESIALLGTLECEQVRLTQVLENLISNSCKYADQDKAQPFVEVTVIGQGERAIITVADNGVGIPKSAHKDLFQRFKRFHPDMCAGSGLGLSIVKRHVEKMGGTIECRTYHNESNAGVDNATDCNHADIETSGTQFVITLPLALTGVSQAQDSTTCKAGENDNGQDIRINC